MISDKTEGVTEDIELLQDVEGGVMEVDDPGVPVDTTGFSIAAFVLTAFAEIEEMRS